ncbi:type III secretion system cytoplasmic ring protein SctQ [Bosea vestrisii]|uniref:type III secretion system cytoplasmic ring protein SctQ n=1 Tax=Bosea vestrisii TaxID=151416 RepID=UPI0032655D72
MSSNSRSSPLLAKLEAQTGQGMRLVEVREASPGGPLLEVDIGFGQARGKGRLFLFSLVDGAVPPPFLAIASLLRQLPQQKPPLPEDFPVMAAGEIGSLRIAAGILRSARPGDVLLPEECPLARGQITLVVDTLWAPAEAAGERLRLRGRFRPRPNPLETSPMTAPTEATQSPSDLELDDVEVTLVFECGRWPITLGALRSAGEGHVFELGRPLDGPVDILANGRLIGRGEIVRVGDTLGVRLHGRLAGNA